MAHLNSGGWNNSSTVYGDALISGDWNRVLPYIDTESDHLP